MVAEFVRFTLNDGSAVLVGPQYLVTAAHVLQRQDSCTLAKVAVEQVELEFPDQGPGGQPGTTAAARVDLGTAGLGADVAVLDLGEDRDFLTALVDLTGIDTPTSADELVTSLADLPRAILRPGGPRRLG